MPESRGHELVRGELVGPVSPSSAEHGRLQSRIDGLLRVHVEEEGLGEVFVEAGFTLARDPDTVRAPDVAYISTSRLPDGGFDEAFPEMAPDLGVEIVSPDDRAEDLHDKIRLYLEAGARLVWVVHPRSRTVSVHRPTGEGRTLTEDDTLEGDEVLAGLSIPVATIFTR